MGTNTTTPMERHNITLQKRTRVMSESTSGRKSTTLTSSMSCSRSIVNSRSRLLSESAVTRDRMALHTHSAPFSLLGSTSRQHKAIQDPEEFLLRSVLVSNTVRHLKKDMRKEKT